MPRLKADNLSVTERIQLAKSRTNALVDHARALLLLRETNNLIVYSPLLSKQIPPSYAAHAFNNFQHSMHSFEIIRLCALWDKPDADAESIPTVAELINSPDVYNQLAAEHSSYLDNSPITIVNPSGDPKEDEFIQKAVMKSQERWAKEHAENLINKLKDALKKIENLRKSQELKAVVNWRDKHLAHSLVKTRAEIRDVEPIRSAKYGEELALLQDSIEIIDALHLGINGASFSWDDAREHSKRYASALWEGCTFNIKE